MFAVESHGDVRFGGNKLCTDRLKFVRALTPCEVLMQLAAEANVMHKARFACNKAMNILLGVISMDSETRDLNSNIVSTWPECHGMSVMYHASRRLSWAQAFNEYSNLPICRVAMHDCGIGKPGLVKLVETLRLNPVLKSDNDKETRNETE